jgi:hypothetical protein
LTIKTISFPITTNSAKPRTEEKKTRSCLYKKV